MATSPRIVIDTANRLRNTDLVRIDGAWLLITSVVDAPTSHRPARMAVTVCYPHGSLSDLLDTHTVHVDAGDTVHYRPGSTHLADVAGRRP